MKTGRIVQAAVFLGMATSAAGQQPIGPIQTAAYRAAQQMTIATGRSDGNDPWSQVQKLRKGTDVVVTARIIGTVRGEVVDVDSEALSFTRDGGTAGVLGYYGFSKETVEVIYRPAGVNGDLLNLVH